MATSGHRAQEPIRAHGSRKCSKHYGKEVIFVCEDCNVLACTDCAIEQHKRHGLEGLANVIPTSKQKLQDFITRAEQEEIPIIKQKFQKVKKHLSANKKRFQNQIIQIKKRNEIVKKKLDKITLTLVQSCHVMEYQNSEELLKHKQELQTRLDEISSKIQEVKDSLQSGNDVLVFDTSHVIPSRFEDLPTPPVNNAEFNPGKSPLVQELVNLHGELNITEDWGVMSELMPFQRHNVKSMHAAGENVWLSFYDSFNHCSVNEMSLVTQECQVQKPLNMDVRVRDFCVSEETGMIWYCSDQDNSIREVRGSGETVKFNTDKQPWCICVTRDDHVLVGFYTEIVKYTQTGQVMCRTSDGPPSVVRNPYHMSECPLTRHIAVVDEDSQNCGGNGRPFVSILDDRLHLLNTYTGALSHQQSPPEQFDPRDVNFTNTGKLVISDWNNKSVVSVTGTGRYIKTLYTSNLKPISLCIHSGALWVSFHGGNIQIAICTKIH